MHKKILHLAVPNIISNITVPLLGMVDLSLVGHLGDKVYIGAIAVGSLIFNFIYWGFSFLRMGTSGLTAQEFGKRDLSGTILMLSRSLVAGLAGAFLLIVLQKPIALISFYLINGSSEVERLAAQYFYIRIWAAPATISLYSFSGWFLGMQNAKAPMMIAILVNIMNIGFNMLFVFGLHMTSNGVAFGTVIAQYGGLLLAVYIFFSRYGRLRKFWKMSEMLHLASLKRFFLVNKDILIRTLCVLSVFTFFTGRSAGMNDTILAVNAILLQLLLFFSFFTDGFAYAAEALTGRMIGAENQTALAKLVKQLFVWGLAVALLFTLVYGLGNKLILGILTDNHTIAQHASEFIVWIIVLPIVSLPAFIWDGVYIGATASVEMRNTMLISTLLIFFPVFFLLRNILGNHALWLAMLLFMITRGILLTLLYKRSILQRIG